MSIKGVKCITMVKCITQGHIKRVEQLKVVQLFKLGLVEQVVITQQRFKQLQPISQLHSIQLFLKLFQLARIQYICHIRLKECTQSNIQFNSSQ